MGRHNLVGAAGVLLPWYHPRQSRWHGSCQQTVPEQGRTPKDLNVDCENTVNRRPTVSTVPKSRWTIWTRRQWSDGVIIYEEGICTAWELGVCIGVRSVTAVRLNAGLTGLLEMRRL
jgi:hypothetical protein